MDCTPVILAHETPFSIGAVEISPSTRELRNNGKCAILEPRVMQVLVALHRARGSVVSKDDLITCCWEGRIVGDDAVNRVIGRLRHDASDHADNAFRVETITRVGYRMVENGGRQPAAGVDRRKLIIAGTAAAAAAGTGVVGWNFLGRRRLSGEAKTLYEDANTAMWEGTADQLSNAVAKLRTATELAPENADVWGLLALAYKLQTHQLPGDQRSLAIAYSNAAAKKALSLDPDNGDALAAQAWFENKFGNWLALEQVTRAALKRSPDNAPLNSAMGQIMGSVGRLRESLFYFDRTARFAPMAPTAQFLLIGALQNVGRLDAAERAIDRAFERWPRNTAIWFSKYYFLMFNGRAQEALSMIRDVARRPIGIPEWNLDLTALQAESIASGDPGKIDATVAKWRETAKIGTGFAENAAIFAGRTGRLDDAFAILEGYYFDRGFQVGGQRWSKEQGFYSTRRDRNTFLLFSLGMEGMRRDARFSKLTREIGLYDYWRKSGTKPDYLA
jgi:DNA-binding winged helix-turn-helix (wHTH) protein/tetratricopeptide (TPR) repeat protein